MLDIFIKISFIYFILRGWSKGFLGSILGPVSLFISLTFGFYYYQRTNNILNTLGISVFGPIVLSFAFSLILKTFKKNITGSDISLASRLSGSLFSLFWSGSYIIALLILILNVPSNSGFLKKAQDYIRNSQTYSFLKKWTPIISFDSKNMMQVFENPESSKKIGQSVEFQNLLENERFKEVMLDEQVQELIKNKDVAGLLSNPKIQSILKDKESLNQLLEANKQILKQSSSPNEENNTTGTKPHVLEIKTEDEKQ